MVSNPPFIISPLYFILLQLQNNPRNRKDVVRNITRMISLTHKRRDMHITYYTHNIAFPYIVVFCKVIEETFCRLRLKNNDFWLFISSLKLKLLFLMSDVYWGLHYYYTLTIPTLVLSVCCIAILFPTHFLSPSFLNNSCMNKVWLIRTTKCC